MTQEQMIELAHRAVSCKGWRWMPGMRWKTEDDRGRLDDYQPDYMGRPPDALPDLADPATLGCFLWLVRDLSGLHTELTFEPGYMLTEVTNLVEALDLVKFPEENP